VLWKSSEFHVDAEKFKYKVADKMRTMIIECVYIYRYVSFVLGILLLIGLILFTWVTLRKIWSTPVR
jgi:hypothetical protein